jgi:hypothetical protein
MKKRFVITTFLILGATALFASLQHKEPPTMKLINVQTGFVVVDFEHGEPHFGDRFLEAEMKEAGIQIPESKRAEFGDKQTILLGDPLFQKAFVEIYVPLSISSTVYQWQQ